MVKKSVSKRNVDVKASKNFGGSLFDNSEQNNMSWWKKEGNKNKSPEKQSLEKQGSLDKKNSSLDKKKLLENKLENKKEVLENKQKYFDRNEKLSSNLKAESNNVKEEAEEIKDVFGYFKTNLGVVEVGYNKFEKNSKLGFSLVPEVSEDDNKISNDKHEEVRFGKNSENKREKRYKTGEHSYEYLPRTDKLEKHPVTTKEKSKNSEDSLIYDIDEEKEDIQKLQDTGNSDNRREINEMISENKNIEKDKRADNTQFVDKIREFVDDFKHSKLKRFSDSDELIMHRKRILELSENYELAEKLGLLLKKDESQESVNSEEKDELQEHQKSKKAESLSKKDELQEHESKDKKTNYKKHKKKKSKKKPEKKI